MEPTKSKLNATSEPYVPDEEKLKDLEKTAKGVAESALDEPKGKGRRRKTGKTRKTRKSRKALKKSLRRRKH